jgi:pimeloyl-ACP methyl ester carboxylesterase
MRMRMFWSDVAGMRIHAARVGAGPPVVLVHGYGVSGAYMRPLARALATSCSALVPDLPGQGKSDALDGRVSIAALADCLGDWIEVNELVRPLVVANSMGCQIATQLAVTRPERIGPMVLVGPTIDPARRRGRHQLIAALRDTSREPMTLIALAALDDASVGIRGLLTTARAALADRIEERLPHITQPTVVVFGEADGFVSREWAERVTTLLPDGRLVVVPDEPHAVHYTRADLVGRIVRELLVEEREHDAGKVPRRLEQRNVCTRELRQAGVGQSQEPLLADLDRQEAVAFAPYE